MCDRLIQLSFAKILNSKNEKGGAKLRKNLLILRLLQTARNEIKYRSILCQQSDIIPVNYQAQVSDSKSGSLTSINKENTTDSTFERLENNSIVGNCENLSPSSLVNTGSSDSQEKNNLPISNNEVITEQSKTALSSSTVTIKRKFSEMDNNEQLNNNHKKQCLSQSVIVECLSQSVIVGNCQINYPPPIVVVQSVC